MKDNFEKYTDKYFLRTKEILQADKLNPWVRAQVFVRKGPGIVSGVDEAVKILKTYSDLENNGGKIYALNDGNKYSTKETLMLIEGRIDDIVALETQYLGVISKGLSLANGDADIDLEAIEKKSKRIVELTGGRPVIYMGARHWHFENDSEITKAAFAGGMNETSTDVGAATVGKKGIGTIPHALENIYGWKYGRENAVVKATEAFDKFMDKEIPRIALIDYNNKEIDDSIATANSLEGRLSAVRVDTCGENFAQGALVEFSYKGIKELTGKYTIVPKEYQKYWAGTGVTVSGVYALRQALNEAGHESVDIILSSGFADEKKIKAFNDAEKRLGVKLYNSIGVGGVYKSRATTMDIVAVGDTKYNMNEFSKVGRTYNPNPRLTEQ